MLSKDVGRYTPFLTKCMANRPHSCHFLLFLGAAALELHVTHQHICNNMRSQET